MNQGASGTSLQWDISAYWYQVFQLAAAVGQACKDGSMDRDQAGRHMEVVGCSATAWEIS